MQEGLRGHDCEIGCLSYYITLKFDRGIDIIAAEVCQISERSYNFKHKLCGFATFWVHVPSPFNNKRFAGHMLTLNVRGPSYLGLTTTTSWLLMPWLLTSPGCQQP